MKCRHLGIGSACIHLLHQGNEASLPHGREVLRTTGTTGALLRGRDVTACLPHAGALSAPEHPEKCHKNTNIHRGPEQSFSPPCARPDTQQAKEARRRAKEITLPQLQRMQGSPDPQCRQHRAQPAEKRHRGLPGSRAIFNLPKTQTLMTQHQTLSQRQQHWLQVSSGAMNNPSTCTPPQNQTAQAAPPPASSDADGPQGQGWRGPGAPGTTAPLDSAAAPLPMASWGLASSCSAPDTSSFPPGGHCFSNCIEGKTLLCTSLHNTCKGTNHLTVCRHPTRSPYPQLTLGYLALPKGPPGRRQPPSPDFLLLLLYFTSSSAFLTVLPFQVSLPSSPKLQEFSKGRSSVPLGVL